MNTQNNNVIKGREAQDGMMTGVFLATTLIRPTYGAAGTNVVVENHMYPGHEVVNDAQTIIQALQATNPDERRGLGFVKELSDKAEKDSGDGRKTTCIIAEEILSEGQRLGVNGVAIKKELDDLIPIIEQKLDGIKKEISIEEIKNVATVAGESEEIGNLLQAIYRKIEKTGIIHLEGSGTYSTSVTFIDGVRLTGTGYLSPFMVHDEAAIKEGRKETKAVYENPTILVTKKKINHINDINPLLTRMQAQSKKDLIIFTDDMDSAVGALLVDLHKSKVMNVLIIKAPVLFKGSVFEDFAKITGSTIVEDASGKTFKNLTFDDLGTCGKIVVDRDETIIIGGQDITDHIQDLKTRTDEESALRLSWLVTKTAIIKIGANNESELSHKRRKIADAISSARLALEDGIVPGGGIALDIIADEMPSTVAGDIMEHALRAPLRQNLANMDISEATWDRDVVVDSCKVVKNAVRNAISLASTVLTTGAVVYIPPMTDQELALLTITSKSKPSF